MAKPILSNPIIKGKSAREFKAKFLCKTTPTTERIKQNRKDVEVFLTAKPR